MSKLNIHGGEKTVDQLFSDEYRFSIPDYQRQYSWTPTQAGELLDDLLYALNATPEDPDPYFLGSVVLVKEETTPEAQVVDGQQRLTTITILLAALADSVPSDMVADVRKRIRQEADSVAGKQAVARLAVRDRDQEFFAHHFQSDNGLDELIGLDATAEGLTEPRRNMQANAQLFLERLRELGPEACAALTSFVVTKCVLVAVSTPDLNSAYRIFSVLNERGLDLSPADIFKSEVIGNISEDLRPKYTERWEEVEDELGREGFGDLFAHIRMVHGKQKARRSLLYEFREQVMDRVPDPKALIDDVISPFADHYLEATTASYRSDEHQGAINSLLRWMGQLDNFDWIPPSMVFLKEHHGEPEAVVHFLTDLDRLMASMFIQRIGLTKRVERLGRVLSAIEAGDDLSDPSSPLQLSGDECAATIANLDGELYRIPRIPKFVLMRLDDALAGEGAKYEYPVISVEHVLPQSPAEDSEWVETFSDDEHAWWVHRLGNLVLLSRRKNSRASNYDFEKKKEKYFSGSDGASPFVLTTQVVKEDTWTPEVLGRRQADAVSALTALWRLDDPADPDTSG